MAGKQALRDELVSQLAAQLAHARAAHASAVEGATHPEAQAENDKDTRGLEQSYIARGQARRVAELEAAVADVARMTLQPCTSVTVSALVRVDDGSQRTYFIAPHGGGHVLADAVQVVTLSSPIGRALLGKRAGDELELRVGGEPRELAIVAVE